MALTAKKEYPEGYPSDVLDIIRTMSFTKGKSVHIVGSMSLRSQLYAGDYDCTETVEMHGDKKIALRNLARKFKSILRGLHDLPNVYIGDIKAGSVQEWIIIQDDYDYKHSLAKLEELYAQGIINDELYQEGRKRIKPRVTKLELLELKRDFRPNIIRWKPREVLQGYKTLSDGRKYTLEEAFQSPTIAKLDVIAWVQNNRFTDFSVIYEFKHNGKILNPFYRDIEQSLRENIFMLWHEKNYFKMAKRMFALAKYKGWNDVLEKLSPLFNSDGGRVYMIYGDIGTLEDLLEFGDMPYAKIEYEIDQFRARLSNVNLSRYISQEDDMFRLIDKLVELRKTKYVREDIINILDEMKRRLGQILSYYAKVYLDDVKLFPNY